MTPTHGSQTLSFLNLVAEATRCQYLKQQWGDGIALGFRGQDADILLAETLFANYDLRPKTKWDAFPAAPRLTWVFDSLAYIYLTEERLLNTMVGFFEVMIAREIGHPSPARLAPVLAEIAHTDFNEDCPHASSAHWTARSFEFTSLPDEPLDEPDQSWEVNDKEVRKLAVQAAMAFIEDHIRVSCFLPDAPAPLFSQFSTGRHHDGDDQSFESLVDRAAINA